ncbi:hypothetical protein [Natrinema versiforme]|uniref:Uncharacterized protein n=1 Tax=Natrinema versiforme JCM 10478 TaxID=1227496 RepID=L9Y9V9_9EURY|nr:hypothetical protein [Natrinema versiforme]ELY70421.1 hypothetical protein C489_02476 [Natrinema versiforme JCM 10478]
MLDWFRDDDGSWQLPEGRRGEFVALLVGFPFYVGYLHWDIGLPRPLEYWPAVLLGACCGLLYVTTYRDRIADRLPDWADAGQLLSLLLGGGLGLLRLVHIAAPTLVFLLSACGTALLCYAVRLCSPVHPGLEPPPRGADPPPAVDGTDASVDR